MDNLAEQIREYNSWIQKKETKIQELKSQKRELQDAEKKEEFEQDI
jgi:hypothetical protein